MPKYYKREIPDLNGTGERQYRYELRSEGLTDLRQLAERLTHKYRMLTTGEIMAIIMSTVQQMVKELADGRNVSIDGLGTFSLSLGTEHKRQHYSEEDAAQHESNARSIIVRNVNFRASDDIITEVNRRCSGHLHRETGGPVLIRHDKVDRDERIRRTLQYIRQHGFIRLAEYAVLCNVSRSVASRQLSELSHDRSVPITFEGRGPSRIWVEDKSLPS